MDKEEILKEFDRKVNYENYLNRDEGEIPHEKLRAFIEEAIDQAKLDRTEEILSLMEDDKGYVAGSCECCDRYLKILLQIRSLLTKQND